jgi:hypothetical protein
VTAHPETIHSRLGRVNEPQMWFLQGPGDCGREV